MNRSSRCIVLVVLAVFALCGGVSVRAKDQISGNETIVAKLHAGKFAEAEVLARKRLAAVERGSGPESVETADVLDLLSEAMRQGGKSGRPEVGEFCERAVRIKEKVLGKEDPGYAASLYQLGSWHYMNGDYGHARPLLEESLRIREKTLSPDHLDVAASLLMLGALRSETGDNVAAKTLVERSLAIRESVEPDGPDVAESLSCLASILVRMGDYAAAEPMYRRAIHIWERAWGSTHAKVGTGWNNLSTLLYATGDYEGALSCKERALQIRIKTLGPNHEMVGWTRANMGMNLAALGRKPAAREQYRQAVEILERRFGRDSPEVGWTLKRLGDTYLGPGQYGQAVPILERAVSNLRAGDGPEHPDVGEAMAALGVARTALGDTATGNVLNRRALAILESRLGRGHPEVGFTLTQYASALMVAGAEEPALEEALQGEDVSRDHLRLTCRTMPERAALAYAASRPAGGRLALSILGSVSRPDGATLARVWDSLIRSRTLVLDEMTSRMRTASEAKDPEMTRLVGNLIVARRRLANLIVSGPGDASAGQYRASVEKARLDDESAERALSARSTAFARDQERGRAGLREVSSSLPPGSALLAYAAAGEGSNRSYVAFVMRAGTSEIFFVPIGSASRVEIMVARWLSAVSAAGRRSSGHGRDPSRAAGDSLAALLWAPVATSVDRARRLFVVGDGAILLVNFAALPAGRDRYLVEDGPVMHYLSSERDLVRPARDVPAGVGLLALGDPAFDQRGSTRGIAQSRGEQETGTAASRDAWNCGDFRDVRFTKLPQTGVEAREVARIWGDPAHTKVLTGTAASERALKAGAPGRRVLHLATHGFFLDGDCDAPSASSRGIGGTSPLSAGTSSRAPNPNPTHLSGLALAGANERAEVGADDEDGILTAEEIASLDLSGTDWAVLSACDTGKGQIQVGEGVLGLRRAFQSAGARTVIMSLWAVDDVSTREWMKTLYEGRVGRKLDTADAVAQADLQVLRARRAQARSTDPFYWAAFVATGDWK